MSPIVLYIHGFNSSPKSFKAQLLDARIASDGEGLEFRCPALPHFPGEAIGLLEETLEGKPKNEAILVGSSLGGFYATHLTEKHGYRSILINPAINPHVGLEAYLGPQRNLYTHEEYTFTREHLNQLEQLYIERPEHHENYLLMHTMGDELLDWRIAAKKYNKSQRLIIQGSDHGFAEFKDYLDVVMNFIRQEN